MKNRNTPYFPLNRSMCFILLCLLSSCKSNVTPVENSIKFLNPEFSDEKIDLLKHIQEVELVPLQSSNKYFLNHLVDIHVTGDLIVLRSHNSSYIFIYNSKGEFVSKIDKIGEGPYEFSSLMDITMDIERNHVYLLDWENSKILSYDIAKEEFENEINLKNFTAFSINYWNDQLQLVTNDFSNGIIKVIDRQGNILVQDVTSPLSYNLIASQTNILEYNDTIFFNSSFADTVYYFTGHEILPYAYFNNKENSISNVSAQEISDALWAGGKLDKHVKGIIPRGRICKYQDLWFIDLMKPSSILIWNKKNDQIKTIYRKNIKNIDLVFGNQNIKIQHIDEEGFAYSYIFLNETFYEKVEKVTSSEGYDKLIQQEFLKLLENYPKRKKFENPIIVKFKLKNSFSNITKT